MTNRFLFPLYLCFLSLPSFAADSGGVETWSPVIRPGAPNRSAKSDEQDRRKAESTLQQLVAERRALADENQRLKVRLETRLDPMTKKLGEKPTLARRPRKIHEEKQVSTGRPTAHLKEEVKPVIVGKPPVNSRLAAEAKASPEPKPMVEARPLLEVIPVVEAKPAVKAKPIRDE